MVDVAKIKELNLDDYKDMQVPVGISNKHVHVCQADLDVLFGEGHELTPIKDLSQPGQFACDEKVDVVGPKGTLKGVRILGPVRPETQVELAQTDARAIGVNALLRESGKLEGTQGCKLVGPKGEVEINEGVIVAKRHIHMTTADAAEFGLADKQVVSVKIDSPERSLVFGDVVVRVNDSFALAMHIDTDEANAVLAGGNAMGEIIK